MSEQELSAEQMLESVRAEAPATNTSVTPDSSQAPAQSPFDPEKIEYDWNGKKIVENLDMIKKRASMGYDYAQKMALINQEREKYKGYDQKLSQLERWQQYNDYAEKNPEWAKHVEEAWNSRQNVGQSAQEQINPVIQTLQERLASVEALKDEWLSEKQKVQQAGEDKQFVSEIEATGKKFGVDLTQSDEQGRTLEYRTLEVMREMGLDGSKPGHFEMAFKHMYFDNLMGKNRDAAKEQAAKQTLEMKKAGILDVSRTPRSAQKPSAFNPRIHSYDDASRFAMQDLEAARKG